MSNSRKYCWPLTQYCRLDGKTSRWHPSHTFVLLQIFFQVWLCMWGDLSGWRRRRRWWIFNFKIIFEYLCCQCTGTVPHNHNSCIYLSTRGRRSQSRKGKKVHKTLCLLLQCLICSLSQKWWHGMGCISGGNCKCSRPPSPLLPIITAATAS